MWKSTIFGILYSCPTGERNQECPVKSLDHLSFQEKVDWFKDLSEDERRALAQKHSCCSSSR
ncbi:hypothetical protein, partial [Ancylomarina sp.]|uniref:hypothetical protein n=1 Tax=Ancylomarina sp. TaxID=1970196 RepID=UPI003566E4E0